MNWTLFGLRASLVSLLAFLLMGPIVRQINNIFEKPLYVFLYDNSRSIGETTDTLTLNKVDQQLKAIQNVLEEKGYEVRSTNLAGEETKSIQYNASASDINAALKKISNLYEGQNVAGVVLFSDGIYNNGVSPLYNSYNFPVYSVGIGDTVQRIDLSIKNIAYNKIAYQGNKFPVRAEVLAKGLVNQNITVTLLHRGTVLEKQTKNSNNSQLLTYDFEVLANDQGIQRVDIQVEVKPEEGNTKNNRTSVFVEVVDGKKKILVVAPSPHPDIKALREVVDKNSNFEFLLHIPGLSEQPASVLNPLEIDLAIFVQSPDVRGKTKTLFQQFATGKTPLLIMLGQQSDLPILNKLNMPVKFLSPPREYDEVTPIINSNFSNFSLTSESNSIVSDYPPVSVHFGKIQIPLSATPLLYQRVGSLATDKPLLAIETQDARKISLLLGEGIWRWRMNEFDKTENTVAFDQLFGKLFQYLSTAEDKRKFRSYPIQQEFSDAEPVIFESQVYNDIFEPIYGNTIDIELGDERGKKHQYTYITNASNTRYQIGGLKEGIYRYKAKTNLNGKTEEVKGEFIVAVHEAELQNLTADFGLLKKLSANTDGKFFPASKIQDLNNELKLNEAKSIIHSEEQYNSVINLKWVFFLLLVIVSIEWFLRKYFGSY